jgi:hypothetical protein
MTKDFSVVLRPPSCLRNRATSAIIPTMTLMTNDQLAALAKSLVEAASQKNLTLRVMSGVAVYLTCPSIETHPALQRQIKDVDFVAPRTQWDALAELFQTLGATPRERQQKSWVFDHSGAVIELCDARFDYNDLTPRLALALPTLPLADVLLFKLQRQPFEERDIQDAIALLLDHRVAKGEAEDQINHEYIAQLCRSNWNLFHRVYDNTVTLEKILDKYIEPEEAQLVWRRIELIQGDMDQQPKSLGWMINQFLKKPTQVPR